MKKKAGITCLLITLLISFMGNYNVVAQNINNDRYAFDQNKKMGRGINIIGYDPIWKDFDLARMHEKHFKLIKDAGFNNVRIKVSPFGFSMHDSGFTIQPAFFTTLDWIVKQCLKHKLMTIIDFHEHGAMEKDPNGTRPMLVAMWKQIAEHYKNLPNDVLFEIANEPNMKPELWNEIYNEAYQAIRKSNPKRTLVIGTVYGNQISFLKNLVLPENDRNIIVAVHYYSPIQFTHQGAPWSVKSKDLSGVKWSGTEEQKQAVQHDFDVAQNWSKANNRPITLGEFGAYEKGDMASRVTWTDYIARQAEARGWSWSYWQFDSDFIVYDMHKDEWVAPIKNALIPQ